MSPARPHRMLWSYHYAKGADLGAVFAKMGHRPEVFADSGAYSAHTQGVPISLPAYGDWLLAHRGRFAVYANLDVIGDPAATWANQEALERRGLRPLPVFHYGRDLSWLDRYADAGHDYIALGGLVGAGTERLMPWLVACFKWARARRQAGKPVVFHGFGLTSLRALADLPWHTVDSTSWNSAARYASLKLFDPRTGGWCDVQMFRPRSVVAASSLLALYGYATTPFLDRRAYHFTHAVGVAARSWRAFEDYCRRRHGPQERPGHPAGLHIYLADGSQQNHIAANLALTEKEPA